MKENTPNKKVKVRFAPSPTGALHIGGVRTALFNYLFAKKHGGEFFMRIEDTDSKRFDSAAEEHIKESLSWLGITPDYVTERQSERAARFVYDDYVSALIDSGHAYKAFDTADELTAARDAWKSAGHHAGYNHATRTSMRNSLTMSASEIAMLHAAGAPYVVRFKAEPGRTIVVDDLVKGRTEFDSGEMDDKVLLKNDGVPTYHLANVVDDHLMGVTHVIRGDEWLTSAALHMALYEALGWEPPKFAHLPLVLAPNGKEKLSKRNALKLGYTVFAVAYKGIDSDGEDVNLPGFREMGYEPGALLNFLALLGWHPSGDREIMSTDELVSAFELERCSPSGARFDFDKLNHFNFEYVRALPDTELVPPGYFARFDAADYLKVAEWTRERAHFRRDAPATWRPFFFAPDSYLDMDKTRTPDAKAVWREFCTRAMRLREDRGHALPWTRDAIEAELSAVCESLGVKKGKVMPFLRTALTGGAPGPDLLDTLRMLGRHDGTDRILDAISLTTKS